MGSITPEFDRKTDERRRRVNLAVVVAPADQRFEADHLLVADVDLRLECADKSTIANRQTQALFGLHSRGDRPPHIGIEIDCIALGVGFRPVHRVVGIAAQFLVARAVLRINAHADRSRGKDLEGFDLKWLLEGFEYTVDNRCGSPPRSSPDRRNSRNSSPLMRASMSLSRRRSAIRRAIFTSSASPMAWL